MTLCLPQAKHHIVATHGMLPAKNNLEIFATAMCASTAQAQENQSKEPLS
jgi:predicted hotdog family 3-hydroxylacyl-ACP dehydratase